MSTATPVRNTDTKVVTGEVRFSYVHVFQPREDDNGQERYSMCILIPKTDKATLDKIRRAVEAAKQLGVQTKWGGKLPANLKMPLRDGDAERPDDEAFKGHFFINCNSRTKPGIVDAQLNEILDPSEVYSGAYGRVSVNFYPYDHKGNRGIACGLNNVQKLRDGDYLGGRSRPEDDFGDGFGDQYVESAGGTYDDLLS